MPPRRTLFEPCVRYIGYREKKMPRRSVYFVPPTSEKDDLHVALANWLDQYHGRGWTIAHLQCSYLCLFMVDDDFAALIWFAWEDYEARIMSVHICVDPAYRRTRWATRKELTELFKLDGYIVPQPRAVLAQCTNRSVITILSLFGFKFCKSLPLAYLEVY